MDSTIEPVYNRSYRVWGTSSWSRISIGPSPMVKGDYIPFDDDRHPWISRRSFLKRIRSVPEHPCVFQLPGQCVSGPRTVRSTVCGRELRRGLSLSFFAPSRKRKDASYRKIINREPPVRPGSSTIVPSPVRYGACAGDILTFRISPAP